MRRPQNMKFWDHEKASKNEDTKKKRTQMKSLLGEESLWLRRERERKGGKTKGVPCSNPAWQMDCWVWGLLCFLLLVFVEKEVTAAYFFCSKAHQGQTYSGVFLWVLLNRLLMCVWLTALLHTCEDFKHRKSTEISENKFWAGLALVLNSG